MSINIQTKDINTNEVNNINYVESPRVFSPRPAYVNIGESEIEKEIINSLKPIPANETEEATALGYRGVLLNKKEIENWNGPPLNQYKFSEEEPVTIFKPNSTTHEYIQNVIVRYLKPPTPPPPGDLVIRSEVVSPQAPPQIIRQIPSRAPTPEPIIM